MNVPQEILKKVKLLEINTRKLVNNIFAGEYHTAFKGQGMTFAEFREYVPGDDVRTISWPVTARTGKTFIKKFDEERELTLILAVDVSGSSNFGSGEYFKGEVMAHLSALLCFSAARNNDQVGLVLFSNQVEHFVPPKKGRGHIHRILRDLYYFKPKNRQTRISSGLDYLLGLLKKRSTIFLLSDFFDEGFGSTLRAIGSKHDVVAVVVQDQSELSVPAMGVIEVEDAETGRVMTIDTSSRKFQRDYQAEVKKRKEIREKELRIAQVDRIDILSNQDFVDPLVKYFRKRNRR